MSSAVPVGALIGWMLLLTVKHVIADFMLQNSWMAFGKDQKTGWALPLLAHCLVHLAVGMALILIVAPRFWFVAFIDFAIHITVDRIKGIIASRFGVTQENPTGLRERDVTRSTRSVDQALPDDLLECRDLLADRRLGIAEGGCRLAEGTLPPDRFQSQEVPQFDA